MADVCFYAMFVLVACSLLQLTRGGAILVDRARLIDLLAFACSTLLVVWVFVIGDAGRIGNVSAAYVIGALLLLAVAGRLVAVGRPTSSACCWSSARSVCWSVTSCSRCGRAG